MKKFRFSLHTVHQLRERAQAAAEAELARANGEVAQAIETLAAATQARENAMNTYTQMLLSGRISQAETTLRAAYLVVLAERIAEAQQNLAERERRREIVRQQVITATTRAEATATLRDQQLAAHRAEAAREEQEQLDEIATLRAARHRLS